jgi:hypothetical protein
MKKAIIIVAMVILFGSFCTSTAADLLYGQWHITKVNKGRCFLSPSDEKELSSRGISFLQSIRFPYGWTRPSPLPNTPELQSYVIWEHEYGYVLIETTREGNTEHLKWGWRMVVENKTKKDVLAHARCSLYDKNKFLLAEYANEYANEDEAVGTIAWKGNKVTLQDESVWSFNANTKPYPPSRIASIECTLLLKPME